MKILVTGANGQLGFAVVNALRRAGLEAVGADKGDFDITVPGQVEKAFREFAPEGVIHCAAYTAVDKAEDEREECHAVNVLGTRHLAQACKAANARMIHISTDFVFDGRSEAPYETTDTPNPINHYGRTKCLGELEAKSALEKLFIVRTSWVFGAHGHNFVQTILRLSRERPEIRVVDDQVGSPTYTDDLAVLLAEMIVTDKYGTYHATNEGYCTWYGFAREIARIAGLAARIVPITTEEYPRKAVPPKNSRLSKDSLDRAGFARLPHYADALKRYMSKIGY